jgi:hypothetical protein
MKAAERFSAGERAWKPNLRIHWNIRFRADSNGAAPGPCELNLDSLLSLSSETLPAQKSAGRISSHDFFVTSPFFASPGRDAEP